ncbi:MAG: LON peptidase substrate-binding domain-containing protein [Candidatus Rariloculaceae bacterium]
MIELPLFPLNTVLFPGGKLPLRIFEPRYLSMISRCLKRDEGFGVVLIKEGSEVGTAEMFEFGTVAEITDWHQGTDGLLGVTATGTHRFRLLESSQQSDGLYIGQAELIAPEPSTALSEKYEAAASLLRTILDELGAHYADIGEAYDDSSWVGYRVAEILPLPTVTKQDLLEMSDPEGRLEQLEPLIENHYSLQSDSQDDG